MNTSSPIELRPTRNGGRWFCARCVFSGRVFGGIFTEAESDWIMKATSGLAYGLSPAEFGQFAAAALRWCRENPTSTIAISDDFANSFHSEVS